MVAEATGGAAAMGAAATGAAAAGVAASVADPGCLSRIPDPDFYPSRIPDPASQIPKQQQKREVKKN